MIKDLGLLLKWSRLLSKSTPHRELKACCAVVLFAPPGMNFDDCLLSSPVARGEDKGLHLIMISLMWICVPVAAFIYKVTYAISAPIELEKSTVKESLNVPLSELVRLWL